MIPWVEIMMFAGLFCFCLGVCVGMVLGKHIQKVSPEEE